MFWAIDYVCLAIILACALLVLRIRNLNGAVVALSGVGTVLSLLFVVLGAPDDAHSEIVVGAVALPVLYLIAIAKIRTAVTEPDLGEAGEDRETGNGSETGDGGRHAEDTRDEDGGGG